MSYKYQIARASENHKVCVSDQKVQWIFPHVGTATITDDDHTPTYEHKRKRLNNIDTQRQTHKRKKHKQNNRHRASENYIDVVFFLKIDAFFCLRSFS